MTGDDFNSAYNQVLHRAFLIAAETGEWCRPIHLLAALAEGDGPISDALRPPDGGLLFPRSAGPPPVHGGGASYLTMQTQQAARQLASQRGETATPEHLFLAVLDQADPEAVALLSHAGLDLSIIRTTALDILGAPSDLPSEPHRAEPSSGGWIEGAFMPARATRRGPAPLPITRPDPWVHTRAPV